MAKEKNTKPKNLTVEFETHQMAKSFKDILSFNASQFEQFLLEHAHKSGQEADPRVVLKGDKLYVTQTSMDKGVIHYLAPGNNSAVLKDYHDVKPNDFYGIITQGGFWIFRKDAKVDKRLKQIRDVKDFVEQVQLLRELDAQAEKAAEEKVKEQAKKLQEDKSELQVVK
jgi:hypothetical protein